MKKVLQISEKSKVKKAKAAEVINLKWSRLDFYTGRFTPLERKPRLLGGVKKYIVRVGFKAPGRLASPLELSNGVYKDAKKLFKIVYDIINKLPENIRYELGSQIIKASFSVILNIAEGSGKSSDKELKRYFDIAIGSLNETVAGIDVLTDNGFIEKAEFNLIVSNSTYISKQLGGFKKKLL